MNILLTIQNVCLKAYENYIKYDKKSELRRTCDTIRTHLTNNEKYSLYLFQNVGYVENIIWARFQQLKTALKLDAWNVSLFIPSLSLIDSFQIVRNVCHL